MSTPYKLDFKRYSKRGVSDLISTTAMQAMTTQAYQRMVAAEWIDTGETASDLPPHKYTQTGFLDTYDAAKYCGDYSSAKQKAYACAVCYSIKIPSDALAGTVAKIESIAATLYGDRWTSCGGILSAILSSSATPPTWDSILAATYTSPDPVTAKDDADPTWQAPLRQLTRSNDGDDTLCEAALALSTGVDATAYLHIILRLGDYIATAGAWIEGGVLLFGDTLEVTFNRTVVLGSNTIEVLEPFSFVNSVPLNQGLWNNNSTINNQVQTSYDILLSSSINSELVTSDFVTLSLAAREGAGTIQGIAEVTTAQSLPQVYNGVLPAPVSLPSVGYGVVLSDLVGGQKLYRHFLTGGFFARGGYFNDFGTLSDGLSFENGIEAVPLSSLVFRLSVYVLNGTLPYASDLAHGLTCNCVSRASAFDPSLIFGSATSISMSYSDRRGQPLLASTIIRQDSEFQYGVKSVPVTPLGHVDFESSSGFEAGSVIPFSTPYLLPRHAVFFLNVAVIKAVQSTLMNTSQAVSFSPGKFFIHKA